MHVRFWVAVGLGAALAAAPATSADDDLAKALATLKAVGKEGKGNEDAGPAWKAVVGKGGAALMPTLGAVDDAHPTAANWLRTAAGAVAEAERTAGRALPAKTLEAFATDTRHAPSARRLAYELLLTQDPAAKARLLPGFINDKSPDLRRDAVAARMAELDDISKPVTRADYEKLLPFARDKDQVEFLAKAIDKLGGRASTTEHFGFVTAAHLVGPFDAPESKGYTTAYPPDAATAPDGAFKGKDGAEVKWAPAATADRYGTFDLNKLLGKHKNAVAYALAVVVAPAETPCEVRVTSPTSVKTYLNGKEIFGRDEYHHGDPFDAHTGRGTLKKGENVVVVKVCQNDQPQPWAQRWQFQVRVCDDTGGALPLEQKAVVDGQPKTVKLGYNPTPAADPKEEKK
ncbi:MAG: hypothetical protein C0501_21485 [Isosphaera sp.]|nr:hypothetical protein [Isosphaera sp.]